MADVIWLFSAEGKATKYRGSSLSFGRQGSAYSDRLIAALIPNPERKAVFAMAVRADGKTADFMCGKLNPASVDADIPEDREYWYFIPGDWASEIGGMLSVSFGEILKDDGTTPEREIKFGDIEAATASRRRVFGMVKVAVAKSAAVNPEGQSLGAFQSMVNGVMVSFADYVGSVKLKPVGRDEDFKPIYQTESEASGYATKKELAKAQKDIARLSARLAQASGLDQPILFSDKNTKTINGQSLIGSGDITISQGGSYTLPPATETTLGGVKVDTSKGLTVAEDGLLGTQLKTINGQSIYGTGDINAGTIDGITVGTINRANIDTPNAYSDYGKALIKSKTVPLFMNYDTYDVSETGIYFFTSTTAVSTRGADDYNQSVKDNIFFPELSTTAVETSSLYISSMAIWGDNCAKFCFLKESSGSLSLLPGYIFFPFATKKSANARKKGSINLFEDEILTYYSDSNLEINDWTILQGDYNAQSPTDKAGLFIGHKYASDVNSDWTASNYKARWIGGDGAPGNWFDCPASWSWPDGSSNGYYSINGAIAGNRMVIFLIPQNHDNASAGIWSLDLSANTFTKLTSFPEFIETDTLISFATREWNEDTPVDDMGGTLISIGLGSYGEWRTYDSESNTWTDHNAKTMNTENKYLKGAFPLRYRHVDSANKIPNDALEKSAAFDGYCFICGKTIFNTNNYYVYGSADFNFDLYTFEGYPIFGIQIGNSELNLKRISDSIQKNYIATNR